MDSTLFPESPLERALAVLAADDNITFEEWDTLYQALLIADDGIRNDPRYDSLMKEIQAHLQPDIPNAATTEAPINSDAVVSTALFDDLPDFDEDGLEYEAFSTDGIPDEEDPYSNDTTSYADFSQLPDSEDLVSRSTSGPRTVTASAPAVDSEAPDPEATNFALFDPHLSTERMDILLGYLKKWMDDQIAPLCLPLPTCALQHPGVLLGAWATYGEFQLANRLAKEGNASAYYRYYQALVTFIRDIALIGGMWTHELQICVRADKHVTPTIEELETPTLAVHDYPTMDL